MRQSFTSKFFSFIPSVVDTADKYSFAIISVNFCKNLKRSQWDTQGPGGHCFMKKNLKSNLKRQTPFKRICLTWSINGAPKQEIGENEVIVGLVQSVVSILYS